MFVNHIFVDNTLSLIYTNIELVHWENDLKEFFKDVLNWVRDMPTVFRGLLIAVLTICFLLGLRYTVKMCYNKDKVKLAFLPIIGLAILVAVTVFLCIA